MRERRQRGSAEPARYALLGLLLEGPHHGYDLSRQFERGTALGEVIHLTMSNLYTLLGGLERDGLIVGRAEAVGGLPTRRVYSLTDPGREAILHWMDEPTEHLRDIRIDFLVKLYFTRGRGAECVRDLVRRQRTVVEEYIKNLEAEAGTRADVDPAFTAVVRSGRLGRARAALDWLDNDVAALIPRAKRA